MKSKKDTEKYVAFLRGINVGGNHKVPMADLKKVLEKLGFENVVTILNSGNVIFDAVSTDLESLEKTISDSLEETFGYPVPTIIRKAETIQLMYDDAPFQGVEVTKDIRLYISLLKKDIQLDLELPWASEDDSFKIIEYRDKSILSILDLSVTGTSKAMEALEKICGKDVTTRNWKTIERIVKKL